MEQGRPAWIAVIGFVVAGVAAIWLTYATILALSSAARCGRSAPSLGAASVSGWPGCSSVIRLRRPVLYWAFMLVMIPLILVDAVVRRVFVGALKGTQRATSGVQAAVVSEPRNCRGSPWDS